MDGVCCDSACEGDCQVCDLEGSVGTCTFVSLEARKHLDGMPVSFWQDRLERLSHDTEHTSASQDLLAFWTEAAAGTPGWGGLEKGRVVIKTTDQVERLSGIIQKLKTPEP